MISIMYYYHSTSSLTNSFIHSPNQSFDQAVYTGRPKQHSIQFPSTAIISNISIHSNDIHKAYLSYDTHNFFLQVSIVYGMLCHYPNQQPRSTSTCPFNTKRYQCMYLFRTRFFGISPYILGRVESHGRHPCFSHQDIHRGRGPQSPNHRISTPCHTQYRCY